MIRFLIPNEHVGIGYPEDIYGLQTREILARQGLSSLVAPLYPDGAARFLHNPLVPGRRNLFQRVVGPLVLSSHLREIEAGDIVWVHGSSLPIPETRARFESSLLAKQARYVFRLEDNWFACPARDSTVARCHLADLVAVSTRRLGDIVLANCPNARVAVFEEPIDIERVRPLQVSERSRPLIVWSGRTNNIWTIQEMGSLLNEIFREQPFDFRIISGCRKPRVEFTFPWEWQPFSSRQEYERLAGARLALAPLEDTAFNRGKANYKIKTYMAAGIAVVTSNVGYNKDLISNGQTGFLADSPGEFKAIILSLLRHPDEAREVGRKARQEMISRFAHDVVVPVWASHIRGLQT